MKTSPPAPKSMRFRLRESVHSDHLRAEQMLEQRDIFSCTEAYADWLSAMLTMHNHFSLCVDQASMRLGLPPVQRLLLTALREDLEAARWPVTTEGGRQVQPTRIEQQIGPAYVLEGSGLGARILLKRAKAARLPSSQYIETLEQMSHARWPVFVSALDRQSIDFDLTANAARTVFEFLAARLERNAA